MATTNKKYPQSDTLKGITRLAKSIDGTLQMKDDILADPLCNRWAHQNIPNMQRRFTNVLRELQHINQTLIKFTKPKEKPVEKEKKGWFF